MKTYRQLMKPLSFAFLSVFAILSRLHADPIVLTDRIVVQFAENIKEKDMEVVVRKLGAKLQPMPKGVTATEYRTVLLGQGQVPDTVIAAMKTDSRVIDA